MAMYASMSCRLKKLLQSYTVISHCGWQLASMDVQRDNVAGCSCQADHTLLRSQKSVFPPVFLPDATVLCDDSAAAAADAAMATHGCFFASNHSLVMKDACWAC